MFLVNEKDQLVCACPHCENVQFMCDVIKAGNRDSLVENLMCAEQTESCLMFICDNCNNNIKEFIERKIVEPNYKFNVWNGGKLEIRYLDQIAFQNEFKKKCLFILNTFF